MRIPSLCEESWMRVFGRHFGMLVHAAEAWNAGSHDSVMLLVANVMELLIVHVPAVTWVISEFGPLLVLSRGQVVDGICWGFCESMSPAVWAPTHCCFLGILSAAAFISRSDESDDLMMVPDDENVVACRALVLNGD
ncbi:hypothetical protein Nepgr_007868 [Nepenthes gracilis]|uniref:Uncharacterized protein n=1 Tax=Nepenthes gracilis TaxID=150966 RepID=A0AAD3XIP9_NEPGR|nr:hypothetical protein Nepgr_007868 [Nepenthes gracilis]